MKTMLTILERSLEVEAFDDSPMLAVSEDDVSRETMRGGLFFELRQYITERASSEKEMKEELAKVFAFFESLPALPEPEPEPEPEPDDIVSRETITEPESEPEPEEEEQQEGD